MAINALDALSTGAAAKTASTTDAAATADRFLKLLVAQMQNQDPLNPMDNAQVTSQMAQINTVNGIERLNTTVQGLSGQFVQMQALQGAALVGHDVVVAGNRLDIADGVGQGGFELAGVADQVKVEVLSPSGQVVDTLNLGAQTAGMHSFDWPAGTSTNDAALSFRVTATTGTAVVTSTALMRDRVDAVSSTPSGLSLELRLNGSVDYADVKAIN
jgi:flagellar basal-body rod modification protein FlgD